MINFNKILSLGPDEAEFSVIDFETTGLRAKTDRAIEVGIVLIQGMKIKDRYSSLINPGGLISPFIEDITGITNAMLIGAPRFEDIYQDILNLLEGRILVGHNLAFDLSFLTEELSRLEIMAPDPPQICTLKLARNLLPDLRHKNLTSVARELGLRPKGMHRALADANITAKVLIKMVGILDARNLDEMFLAQKKRTISSPPPPGKEGLFGLIKSAPSCPGVYIYRDSQDKVIYVGKAKSLNKRLGQYIAPMAAAKSRKIVESASEVSFIEAGSELGALLTESDMIKRFKPKFNRLLKKSGRNYFIELLLDHPYPKIELRESLDFNGNDIFGPYCSREQAEEIIDSANKAFKLRECTDDEFNKHKRCYLADIERCGAPCFENDNNYSSALDGVRSFLQGDGNPALKYLLGKMKRLSDSKRFEEAGLIRDASQRILGNMHKAAILSEPINRAEVLIEIGGGPVKDYFLLIRGKASVMGTSEEGKNDIEERLEEYFSKSGVYNPDRQDLDRIKIALSWIARNRTMVKIKYLKKYRNIMELRV